MFSVGTVLFLDFFFERVTMKSKMHCVLLNSHTIYQGQSAPVCPLACRLNNIDQCANNFTGGDFNEQLYEICS